jgi:hypothetical protein
MLPNIESEEGRLDSLNVNTAYAHRTTNTTNKTAKRARRSLIETATVAAGVLRTSKPWKYTVQ